MEWFQSKEKSAGKKRLILTYYIYKILGAKAVYIIAFFVAFFTFLFANDSKFYVKKYLTVISHYKNIKPTLLNQLKLFVSYAFSLVDKMIMYLGEFQPNNLIFENENEKEQMFKDIEKKQGVCFLFSHIGNIEILQAFFQNQKQFPNLGINVFLNKKQTKIFNNFLDTIKKPIPIKNIIIEEFNISSAIKLQDNIDKGEILFIAGDRLSENNSSKSIEKTMFGKKIKLPEGSFRLTKILKIPIYFICAVKEKNGKYKIYLKKQKENDITDNYIKFMEKIILKKPLQFYNFYDFFND